MRCGRHAPTTRAAALRGRARRRCPRRRSASPSRRRDGAGPSSSAQPMVPVPTMITPPSRPRCAPTQAACASVVMMVRPNGCSCALRRGQIGRLAGAGQRQAGGDPLADRRADRPACCKALAGAPAARRRGSVSRPSRILAGPARRLAQHRAGRRAQPRAALGSAAVDPKKEQVWSQSRPFACRISSVNARERFGIEHVIVHGPGIDSNSMETERASPRYSGIDLWDPGDILDAMIEGQFAAVAAVRAARRGAGARRARHGSTAALSRPAGLCRRRHLGPSGGAGRRRADADLQLAAGAPGAADGRRPARRCCARSKAPRTRSSTRRAPRPRSM